jgi:adenosylcobinamide-GDP ribazoletransferase
MRSGLARSAVSGARLELRALTAAVAFLTRVPVGRRMCLDGVDVANAGAAFPLVGAGVGAAVGGTAAGLADPLSAFLAAALALAVGLALTGALHLDGLADTADALGGGTREHALEIMRDHAVGAYGAAAVPIDLLIKAGALAALAHRGHALGLAVAAGALSRAVPVALAVSLPYARAGGGRAASLCHGSPWRAVAAAVLGVAVAAAAAALDGVVVAAAAAAGALALAFGLRRWLGGVTGDTLGAAVELTEMTVLAVGVGLAR